MLGIWTDENHFDECILSCWVSRYVGNLTSRAHRVSLGSARIPLTLPCAAFLVGLFILLSGWARIGLIIEVAYYALQCDVVLHHQVVMLAAVMSSLRCRCRVLTVCGALHALVPIPGRCVVVDQSNDDSVCLATTMGLI